MAYPPPAYGPPPGQQPYGAAPQNGFGLTSMILGIISIPISCCWYISGVVSIVGLVFGFLGKKKVDAGLANNRGIALAGIITSAVGLALAVVFAILAVALRDFDVQQWITDQQNA
ncbi:DUF4190 domain-containing protein [Actinoplanes sp. GCM10030250]|uniref:DUF4190 domain-containing protein n=1 Tax=Actinoplanes sp. GCM10030250 TaxID=3273376 RepID=UPI003611C034